ncbi:hypothetical protein KVR01_005445 [Diaporthe batatas]|uniref:uncharacterized protein n=1 Tax=Diaporthe batatas TaxID=748121 RepID=UPI001D055C47|nr:uncharacterized protein KVR01_005445 [Diaporthe batatas]KAG8165170.1 hypothetical protein KVR01_005445 [Diaporthe batatas]
MSTFDLQPLPHGGDDSLLSQSLLPSGNFGFQQSATVTVSSIVQSSTASAATGGNTPGPNSGVSGSSANTTASPNITPSPDNGNGSDSSDPNRTTIVVLSTVLSVVGVILVVGATLFCLRCRRRRSKLFRRGITPIDDDEIETWKSSRREKELGDDAGLTKYSDSNGHVKHESVSSTRKSTSVIVYSNTRRSEERSPRSPRAQFQYGKRSLDGRKISLDKELPQTPIQARAPNAREGLTDDAVPGDDPFIQYPKRQTSRLSKTPPNHPQHPRHAHTRTRSSFSLRSLGDHIRGYDSEVELTPRTSQDCHDYQARRSNDHHSRVFSSSSIPPRLSLSNDWPGSPQLRQAMIGRAIG